MDSLALLQSVQPGFDYNCLRSAEEIALSRQWQQNGHTTIGTDRDPGLLSLGWQLNGTVGCSEALVPAVHQLTAICRRVLRIEQPIAVTLFSSPQAIVYSPSQAGQSALEVRISSAVVNHFWPKEVMFLIGRSLAQLFCQPCVPLADPSWNIPTGDDKTKQLRELWRQREVFRDRIGHLCCQELDTSHRALFKMISGLADEFIPRNLDNCGKPENTSNVLSDLSSNDFTLFRLGQLTQFAQSTLYRLALGIETDLNDQVAQPVAPIHEEPAVVVFFAEEKREERLGDTHDTLASPKPVEVPSKPAGDVDLVSPDEFEDIARDVLRDFTLCATLWVLSLKDHLTETESDLLCDLFGDERVQVWRLAIESRGEQVLPATCRGLAAELDDSVDLDHRLGAVREMLSIALAEGPLCPRENDLIVELAQWIGLGEDDLSVLAAEHVDPEFAMYQFQVNQLVDVQLDGHWVRGTVEDVAACGDLRIRFHEEDEVFTLNPVADLVRPLLTRQAC